MNLTGKCKQDFSNYIKELPVAPYECVLDQIPECYLNALIVDFFDSAGITILLDTCGGDFYFLIKEKTSNLSVFKWQKYFQEQEDSKTRNIATNHAIKKANEIYNQKN